MPHDKPRLYVALYARSKPNEYHWALIVDPKKTDARTKTAGIRYHATNSPDSTCQRQNGQGFDWRFERRPLGEGVVAAMLLARIAVGKVKDLAQLEQTLAKVTVRQDSTFTCRTWLIDAVRALDQDGSLGTRATGDWNAIFKTALQYVGDKRGVGRWSHSNPTQWSNELPSTYDMMEQKEAIP